MTAQSRLNERVTGPREIGQEQYEHWRWMLVGSVVALPVGIAALWAMATYDLDPDGPGLARSAAGLIALVLCLLASVSPVFALISVAAGRKVLVDPPDTVRVKRLGLPPRRLSHVSHIEVVETVMDLPRSARTPHPLIDDSGELEWAGVTYRAESELWARRVNRRWGKGRSIRLTAVDWSDRFRLANCVAYPLSAGVTVRRHYPVGE